MFGQFSKIDAYLNNHMVKSPENFRHYYQELTPVGIQDSERNSEWMMEGPEVREIVLEG